MNGNHRFALNFAKYSSRQSLLLPSRNVAGYPSRRAGAVYNLRVMKVLISYLLYIKHVLCHISPTRTLFSHIDLDCPMAPMMR